MSKPILMHISTSVLRGKGVKLFGFGGHTVKGQGQKNPFR